MSVLQKLTEGIVNRNLQKEGAALMDKWEKTGLLEGLDGRTKDTMSVLLENQAKELLREASSMAAGDVEGFAAVAFPIVRRVFGGLIANDLVSVQPMSLPSGLIFFLDFTYEGLSGGVDADDSIYGGGVVGQELTGGVTDITEDGGGFYNLANFYSSPTGSLGLTEVGSTAVGSIAAGQVCDIVTGAALGTGTAVSALTEGQKKAIRYDPDILGGTQSDLVGCIVARTTKANVDTMNKDALGSLELFNGNAVDALGSFTIVRRLTHFGYKNASGELVANTDDNVAQPWISLYIVGATGGTPEIAAGSPLLKFALKDDFIAGSGLGSVVGDPVWGLEEPQGATGNSGDTTTKNEIPEIDIKVDSVAITAVTKKLKAKWSPELGQDLQAYHNLDAEVELTSILSEQIALEIDREILNDLVQGATAGTYHWSRRPGRFLDRASGSAISDYSNESLLGADFTGTVSEWYETLVETINDVSAQIHRKTLRGGANFLVCSPETANILEFTSGFRANITHDDDKGSVGAVRAGNLSRKWDVYVDPYFLRNVVLVGRKGGSFLESGYVYAPYVPLQVTPTIFGTEDFVPRKGVMTRYGKKMVRPDLYGLVVIQDFNG